jgi:hypothetical protein
LDIFVFDRRASSPLSKLSKLLTINIPIHNNCMTDISTEMVQIIEKLMFINNLTKIDEVGKILMRKNKMESSFG